MTETADFLYIWASCDTSIVIKMLTMAIRESRACSREVEVTLLLLLVNFLASMFNIGDN